MIICTKTGKTCEYTGCTISHNCNTAPQQREWVSLTDDEIHSLVKQVMFNGMTDKTLQFARAIEAKLKEKNS